METLRAKRKEMEIVSGYHGKISSKPSMEFKHNLCLWCDLLGFGKELFENQFVLNEELRIKYYNRLSTAHNEFLRRTAPLTESNLVLNDGLVKVSTIDLNEHPDIFGFFLRNCIETHIYIKELEIKSGFPGPRSVITFGQSMKYFHSEVKFDDYVSNYSKKNSSKLSNIAIRTGNPTVVYNPEPFQMNMAFSKAFILDQLGSEFNISGSNIYLDSSVIDFMKFISKKKNIKFVKSENNGIETIYLDKGENHVYFGFELSNKNIIRYNGWNTYTYKLHSFYPPDEPINEFKYEIK